MHIFKRREFLERGLRIVSGSSLAILASACGLKIPTGTEDSPDGNNGASGSSENSGEYVPKVDDVPYFEPEYSLEEDVSDTHGTVTIPYSGTEVKVTFYGVNQRPVIGLETLFMEDVDSGDNALFVTDPLDRYLPNALTLQNIGGARVGRKSVRAFSSSKNVNMVSRDSFSSLDDVIVDLLSNFPSPSWSRDKVWNKSGYVYIGDWSFNDLKNLNTTLRNGSVVLTMVPEPDIATIGVTSFAIFSKTGAVLEVIDEVSDAIGLLFPKLKFDKEKKHSMYYPAPYPLNIASMVLTPVLDRPDKADIRQLFPTQIGNSWTYSSGAFKAKAEITGTKEINGRDLLVIEGGGVKEYFGRDGKTLRYHGLRDLVVEIFFEPAIKIGDDNIYAGKSYETSSRIICTTHPEITGSVREIVKFVGREDIVLSDKIPKKTLYGSPYGNCFKMEETVHIELKDSKTGKTALTDDVATHWLSKDVGKVKTVFKDQIMELVGRRIKSGNDNNKIMLDNLSNSFTSFSTHRKIIETVKRLVG